LIKDLLRLDLSTTPGRKRATVAQAVGGYVNTGIVIVQGLLLVPLYLYFIGAHTYGLWLASGGILGMLGLVNFGISNLLVQRISREYAQQNLSQAGAYFINGAAIYFCICLLFLLAGWLVSIWLPVILKLAGEDAELLRRCFQIAVLALVIGVFNECLRSFCQALLRPVFPVISMVVGRILGICVTVWMIYNDIGLWSIPVGLLITEGFIFILNLLYAVALFWGLGARINLSSNIILEYMRTSPILLLARVGNTLSQESEPLLITVFISPEVTTAYMVTRRAADIVFRLLNVIVGSTMGSFSHLAASGDHEKINSVAKRLLFISFALGVIGFSTYVGTNHAFISLWVGEAFSLDYVIVLFIALGFFARTLRGLLSQILFGLGDFVYPSFIILLEGIVRIVVAVALLSTVGVIGVPIALTVSCVLAIIILGLRKRANLMFNISTNTIARLLLSCVVIFGASISALKLGFDIVSWSGFVLYLGLLFVSIFILFMMMNWSNSRDVFKEVVK